MPATARMTAVPVALTMLAAGFTGAISTPDAPTVAPSAAPAGEIRPTPVRVSRSDRRASLSGRSHRALAVKARRHHDGTRPAVASSHDLPAGHATHDWSGVAACESGGDWSINTGNGYYGGLQFSLATWRAMGGHGLPSDAPTSVQIAVAERLLAVQGGGAWPVCGAYLRSVA